LRGQVGALDCVLAGDEMLLLGAAYRFGLELRGVGR
jgi:hypothetical protein